MPDAISRQSAGFCSEKGGNRASTSTIGCLLRSAEGEKRRGSSIALRRERPLLSHGHSSLTSGEGDTAWLLLCCCSLERAPRMVAHSFLNRMVAQNALATRRHSSACATGSLAPQRTWRLTFGSADFQALTITLDKVTLPSTLAEARHLPDTIAHGTPSSVWGYYGEGYSMYAGRRGYAPLARLRAALPLLSRVAPSPLHCYPRGATRSGGSHRILQLVRSHGRCHQCEPHCASHPAIAAAP